ncbi:hypothetical protein M9Y10_006451 [Tritrichomonas musculus]|uniref:Protein kinase domain-containing protein n=1 Tax=Tritrichomonas musculus TaxID=1915356 RepID=A0ABR2JE72_9EUKA
MNYEEIDLNRFEIYCKIGSGGFAKVYKIKDKDTEEFYAAKIMKKKYKDPKSKDFKQLEHEILTMYELDHPAVIELIGYSPFNFRKKRHPMIITKYYSNGSLESILKEERGGRAIASWDDTRKLIVIYGIASAMAYLHSKKIIHRDLKPDNILMDDYLFPVIADFGLAKNMEKDMQSTLKMKGTIKYMAPEVIGKYEYTEKCDVFAFSLIVYEIMSAREAYDGLTKDYIERFVKVIRPEIDSIIPPAYQELIVKCWSQEPSDRPTFSEIKNMLETNEDFLTDQIDRDEYYKYQDYLQEHQKTLEETGISISKDDFIRKNKFFFRKSYLKINRIKVDEPEDDENYLTAEKYYYGTNQYPVDKKKAASLYKQSADDGNSNAMVKYGDMLYKGDGIPMNKAEAVKYFQMGSEENNTEAVMRYASILFKGEDGIEKDSKKAIELYERAADNGNVKAMVFCANLYDDNNDKLKAMEFYKRAADNDDEESLLNLVKMIMDGYKIDISDQEETKYFKRAADLGDCEAMYHYADALYYGKGVEIDKKYAVELYKKAADSGSSNSMNKYAHMLYNGIETSTNKVEAVKYYKRAIEQNNTDSMFSYGRILLKVDQTIEAAKLFKKAADLNHIKSMNLYAEMLLNGDGIDQNKNEAAHYYKKAADTNDPISLFNYATFLYNENKKPESLLYFERAANLGHVESMFKTALMYDEDKEIGTDYHKAFHFYQLASEKDHLKALNKLGLMYDSGRGTDMNTKKACLCFQKAADLGEIEAMNNYANFLFYGKGTKIDKEQAAYFYKSAADKGNDVAMNNYANMLMNGDGIDFDKKEAFNYFGKAANASNMYGLYNYALLLEEGDFIKANPEEINNLLKLSAKKGHVFAAYKLACILLDDDDGDKKAEAVKLFKSAADNDHVDSMYQYGRCRYMGIGMNADKLEGFLYLRAAALKDHKKAGLFLKCIQSNNVCSIF